MRKIALLFTIMLMVSVTVFAQAYESSIQYDKKKQVAIAIDYTYPPEAVENAIIQKMEKMGYKGKEEKGILNKDKGFLVYKNAYVTDISQDRMDYIIKVERKSRKEKDEAVLYLIMNKDGQNAMATMEAYAVGQAKTFLNDMIPDIEAANLELQIKGQEETLAKAEKKLKGLQDDKIDLERKLKDNEKSQEDTIKDIETEKKNLDTLRSKRKTN